nr:helix-turn-helix transcriptional regulator [Fictibacillus sp. 26RED30]
MEYNNKRTNLRKFLDLHGCSQEDLVLTSRVSRNTISKACTDKDYMPSSGVMKKILLAIRKIDPNAKASDFWDM